MFSDTDRVCSGEQDKPSHKRRWGTISQWCGFFAWVCPLGLVAIAIRLRHNTPSLFWMYVGVCLEVAFPVLLLVALVSGRMAKAQAGDTAAVVREKRRADVGLRLGYVLLVVFLLIVAKTLFEIVDMQRFRPNLHNCEDNLKSLGEVMDAYALDDSHLYFPELSQKIGRLVIRNRDVTGKDIYPRYLMYQSTLFCPCTALPTGLPRENGSASTEACLERSSYIYLGYIVRDDAEMEAFAAAYKKRLSDGLPFETDLTVPDGAGGNGAVLIHRLSKETYSDNARFGIGDISRIPVLIERLGHHEPLGGNVLFLDGHVEYVPYPGPWPMTEKTIGILNALEAYRP